MGGLLVTEFYFNRAIKLMLLPADQTVCFISVNKSFQSDVWPLDCETYNIAT